MPRHLRRILVPVSIITTILALIHILIYRVTSPDVPEVWHLPMMIILIIGLISMPLGLILSHGASRERLMPVTKFAYFWIGFFFLMFSFVLVQLLVSIFIHHPYSYWPLIAAVLAGAWSIFRALGPPRIITHELAGPMAMRGLTLVQISDLHVGMPFLDQEWLTRQVRRINELKPDFVAITGDLADGTFDDVAPALAPLADLKPGKKKYYITGNHEFIRGGDWEKRLRELGFTILHNSHEIFTTPEGRYMIAGVPDAAVRVHGDHFESSPSKALAGGQDVSYRILLAHEPRAVFKLGDAKCDLLLAGHTHGGQIFPFALLVRIAQPVVRGFKKINGVLVFAHMGTGFWGPPMRWLTSSEIVRFRWKTA